MRVLRIYVDTSAIGGCLDQEFAADSRRLIEAARSGRAILLISDVVLTELADAPPEVQAILNGLPTECLENIALTDEINTLRDAYIAAGAVGAKWLDDAAHVAAATVARADAIVSWNFKHIVRLEKIKVYNQVNLLNGYGMLTILSPKDVQIHESED